MDRQIDDLDAPSDIRSRIASGCFSVTQEHQKAVVLLVTKELYASAFALCRPVFESYIRGVWLHRCASDSQLRRYQKDKDEMPKFSDLIAAVESVEGFEGGVFSTLKAEAWTAMNSFTHTGYSQVVRFQTETTIESNFDKEEVVEVVRVVNCFGWMAAIGICAVASNNALAAKILDQGKRFFEESISNSLPHPPPNS